MYTFEITVRLDHGQRMAYVRMQANSSLEARSLAESQYGAGNVANVSQING
jgi:hypothetical protein